VTLTTEPVTLSEVVVVLPESRTATMRSRPGSSRGAFGRTRDGRRRGAGQGGRARTGLGLHDRGLGRPLVLVAVGQEQLLPLLDRRTGLQVVLVGQGGLGDVEALGDGEHRVALADDIGFLGFAGRSLDLLAQLQAYGGSGR
jgi:hypothetical protein